MPAPLSPPTKQALREIALERRAALPDEARARGAESFAGNFLNGVAIPPGAVVAGYWPVRGELDVLPLLRALAARGHVIALPRVVAPDAPLEFRAWREGAEMHKGAFGVMEPAGGAPVRPGVVIVPMAAFDARGHRLGYGAGFYDRTLAALRVLAVGAAFEAQKLEQIPAEPYDVAMDIIVTEAQACFFERRAV